MDENPWLRALAIIQFPRQSGALDAWDVMDLGHTLEQIGRLVAAGQKAATGTVIIPYQRRIRDMKVSMDIKKADGGKYWDFAMSYHNLPEVYAWEIGAKAAMIASAVGGTVGQASGEDPAYTVAFHVVMEEKEPKLPEGVKGQVKADRLLYSQMVAIQNLGVAMMVDLQKGAEAEIAVGLRK